MWSSKESRIFYLWKFLLFVLIYAECFYIPIKLIFHFESSFLRTTFEMFVTVVFAADIFIRKYDLLYEQRSIFHHDDNQKAVKNSYVKSFSFIIDCLSALPIELIFAFFDFDNWLLNFFFLLRVFKLISFIASLRRPQIEVGIPKLVKILGALSASFLFIHWVSCVWIVLRHGGKFEEDLFTTYNKAIYWAVTTVATVGYGDITPNDNVTRLFSIFVMIMGVGLYGIVVGNISQMIVVANRHTEAKKAKMEDINLFMKHYEIPHDVQKQVYGFYNHVMEKRLSENDAQLVGDLPKALQQDVQIYMNVRLIKNISFFKKSNLACLKDVASSLEQVFYSPDELIIKRGDIGQEFYVISQGEVEIVLEGDRVINTLHSGDFFGEMALLEDTLRTVDVRARSYCDLYKLSKEKFIVIIEKYPQLATDVKDAVYKRKNDQNAKVSKKS